MALNRLEKSVGDSRNGFGLNAATRQLHSHRTRLIEIGRTAWVMVQQFHTRDRADLRRDGGKTNGGDEHAE